MHRNSSYYLFDFFRRNTWVNITKVTSKTRKKRQIPFLPQLHIVIEISESPSPECHQKQSMEWTGSIR